MKSSKVFLAVMAIGFSLGLASCKKSKPISENPPPPVVEPTQQTGTRGQLTADSIFLYAKDLYYWRSDLPDYATFNPRQYTDNDKELYALSQISINPSTAQPYELGPDAGYPKYSYIDYGIDGGKKSALKADLSGNADDYGFSAIFNTQTDLRVKYVYPNSPAAKAGLTRGCRITSVNGQGDVSYTKDNLIFLNKALFGDNASVDLKFTDLAGANKTVTVTRATYTENPILYTHVFTVGTKKVGYFVFNSFTNNASAQINAAFADFASKGVTEMVVDLRYNGGGFVSTAAQIINLLGPTAQNGNTMFTYYYSQYLQNLTAAQKKKSILIRQPNLDNQRNLQLSDGYLNGKYATLADINYSPTFADNIEKFQTASSHNFSRVYFLVTGSTASASELTINSLKPVIDVKLIGSTTYGKPVGFFPVHIDKFDLYIPEFETKNQQNVGGYYAGLNVDKETSEDPTKNWGDSTETLLGYALQYAKAGNFTLPPAKSGSLKQQSVKLAAKLSPQELRAVSASLDQNAFQGMVRDRK
ncbi:carboxyl-terminal processing protease [Pedobacter sp. UYP30]|uniref:S41 family peptidase n=1 Tax=Pedobacter sp. UYP30 TaxID=1756400 RepID=UPI003394460A